MAAARAPSLQRRLALAIGLGVTVLWLLAALVTANRLSGQMDHVFDAALQATAQRILPLAIHDLRDRSGDDDEKGEHEIRRLHDTDETVAYLVRDASGQVLLRSQGAADAIFPAFSGSGFRNEDGYRLYEDAGGDGAVTITVAEPLSVRAKLARTMLIDLSLPLLIVIPLSLLAIVLALRRGFRPLRLLEQALSRRGAQDLSPLADTGLPRELRPFADEVNELLSRLTASFEAERSFAANAAHELRTPVAGAIAQAQRLQSETADPAASKRAAEIESTLKRLMRTSEKLMQLARAEGGRMRRDQGMDMRQVLRIVTEDFTRAGATRCHLHLPDGPAMATIEPDALGILCRNLIENALRHGSADTPVDVTLTPDAVVIVANDGPTLPPDALDTLMQRFQKGSADSEGTGLGLAIVKAIVDRSGAELSVVSPSPGQTSGVTIRVSLPRS